jgi:multidrug resistance efflux pump
VADNAKKLEKLKNRIQEATTKKEAEEANYGPLDLLVEQAADRQRAIADQEKGAQEALNEAKAAVETAKVTLAEYKVSPTPFERTDPLGRTKRD